MRQENPVERYGMARYDVANRKPRGQEGAFQRRDGNQARDEARSAARETTAPTFAELQTQGRARPSPMMANVASSFMPGGNVMNDQATTHGTGTLAPTVNPTPAPTWPNSPPTGGGGYDDNSDQQWTSILNNLESQFGGQRARLNEDLARRGLWASTGELGAGARLGDLEGQQSRAIASARTDYQLTKDDRYDRLMQLLLPMLMGG